MPNLISEIAGSIASRKCVLFAGSGLTLEGGGAAWPELVAFLRRKFGYDSPLQDLFQVMGDLCDKAGRTNVYEAVRDRLSNVTIIQPILKLTALNWFTVFTTNYDLALETLLEKNQPVTVRTILTGNEFALAGLQAELLCVKLMGSIDIPDGQPGSMVLDPGDLALARDVRSRIFDILASHAANLSFLFVGYSFSDNLFLESLQRLTRAIGKPDKTYYAIFKNEPDAEKAYLLRQMNVEIIVDDLKQVVEQLANEVALRDPKDLRLKRLPLGKDVIPLNPRRIGPFLSLYNPVFFEDLEEDITPASFFKGNTSSFKPFGLAWHFPRKQTNEIVDLVINGKKEETLTVSVEGNPGTGRTFAIMAAVYKLITEHRSLAIQIPTYAYNPIPNVEVLAEFIQEVELAATAVGVRGPERIVFFSQGSSSLIDLPLIKKLRYIAEYWPQISIAFLSEDLPGVGTGPAKVEVDSDLSTEEKTALEEYILSSFSAHRFPEISREEVRAILNAERLLLPVMYRTLDPARRSIDRIIQEEFKSIADPIDRSCVVFCALSSSIDIAIPVAVMKKALSKKMDKDLSYPDVFESADRAHAFIIQSVDHRSNYLLSIYHSLVAKHICEIVGAKETQACLFTMADTVDLRSRIEAEFTGNILIPCGVNWVPRRNAYRPFEDGGLEIAMNNLRKRQPARPILHHLARLRFKRDPFSPEIVALLLEALANPIESYALEERKENVLTTLGQVKWRQNKDRLLSESLDNQEIQEIISILIPARTDISPSAHPYDVHARILRELSQNKDEEERLLLLNKAAEVLKNGLHQCIDDPDAREWLRNSLAQTLSDINPDEAKSWASDLITSKGDGTGYYTLALIEFHKNMSTSEAKRMLNIALKAPTCPSGAIMLQVEILIKEEKPDYALLQGLVDRLTLDSSFEIDWNSAYYMAVVNAANGRFKEAIDFFNRSYKRAPRVMQREVELFWVEGGRRKTFSGRIGRLMTQKEGRIYAHDVSGWKADIFFATHRQEKRNSLQPGLSIVFELGFSPRGPIAFDVRPQSWTLGEISSRS
jgi:hypothetical protein